MFGLSSFFEQCLVSSSGTTLLTTFSFVSKKSLFLAVLALVLTLITLDSAQAQSYGPNILPAGNFEDVQPTYVPWAGVDNFGYIHGLEGVQNSAGETGITHANKLAPSAAVGDLNGDGKPDLVLADSRGFFWYFPNSGTPQKPVFTQGEIMPIWLAEERVDGSLEGVDSPVPRIQLVDFDHNKRLDILAGTYVGKLFHLKNIGSDTQPNFKPTYDRDNLLIDTRKKGVLWCNFLAPCLTTLFGGTLDLVMGEGTYSANSIYLLRNTGSAGSPRFDQDHTEKIIPGMGLEQLTPVVIDWNNDGKADVLAGDRNGYLTLFLNTSVDPAHPTFDKGTHIKIAGVDKLGNSITVTVCDLTGNGLPNLLIGRDDGTIAYALNTGKIGAPVFNTPVAPLKGTLPPGYNYTVPTAWIKGGAWGAPDELISCVNPKLEPGFTFPDGVTSKYALKFSVWPVKNFVFTERYYPPIEDQYREHSIHDVPPFNIKLNTTYHVHCWIKNDGNVPDLRYKLWSERAPAIGKFRAPDLENPISAGSSWTEFNSDFKIENTIEPTVKSWNYFFEFRFTGQGTFYVDNLEIKEKL